MNVQHSSDPPPFQWAAPGCSNGYKEWYAQSPQHRPIHGLRARKGPATLWPPSTRVWPNAPDSAPATTSGLHCSQPVSLGLLVTTRLEPITEAFRTGPGAAKVYRLSVCKQRGVRTHTGNCFLLKWKRHKCKSEYQVWLLKVIHLTSGAKCRKQNRVKCS
jgi:hypothetical protein